MGHGIAQIAGMSGFDVKLIDLNQQLLDNAIQKIEWSLNKLSEKGRISKIDANETLRRIRTSTKIEESCHSDFIIEAVPENISLKKSVFSMLNNIARDDAVLATNTSSLSISDISSVVSEPSRVIGMHFFYPPQLMRLVEVVKGNSTTDNVVLTTLDTAKKWEKIQYW